MPGPTDSRHNEDQEYLNDLLSNLDDVKQSYIMSQTEANIRQNVSNIEVGYTRIRAYLLEKDIPPAAPGIPDISKPELLQYEQKRIKSISPDFYDHQGSVPPELQMLNLYQYMPDQPDPDEQYRKEQALKEENRRKLLEQREKARLEREKEKEARKNAKLQQQEEKRAKQEMAKQTVVQKPPAPKKVEKTNGSVVRYLIELSDFSDYLRYRISKQGCCYSFFHWPILIIILLCILLTTSITAGYASSIFCNGKSVNHRIQGVGSSSCNLDPKFAENINKSLHNIITKLNALSADKTDGQTVSRFLDQIKLELSQTVGKHTDKMGGDVKIMVQNIQKNITEAQGKTNNDIQKWINKIQLQLENLVNSINNMPKQTVVQTVKEKGHPYQDLIDKYKIINQRKSDTSIEVLPTIGNNQQKVDFIWVKRSEFKPKQCFLVSPKHNSVNITGTPFVPYYLIIGHPVDETLSGRSTAPEFIKVTVEQQVGKTAHPLVNQSHTFHYDLQGDQFQKFDFKETPFANMQIASMRLEFQGQTPNQLICVYQALVLGKYVNDQL